MAQRKGRLSQRLKLIREVGGVDGPKSWPGVVVGTDPPGEGPSQGRALELPSGWVQVHEYIWTRNSLSASALPEGIAASVLSPRLSAEQLVFLDTETTGLSGAGVVVFLVGLGRIVDGALKVEQLFLSDYPGESAFLELLAQRLGDDLVYVSYNGRAFDTGLIRSRFTMHRKHVEFKQQLDLLYPARRLWSGLLDSCSLSSVEKHILGIGREEDVPGALVPEIYFDFLKTKSTDGLKLVFAHHLQDIVTLEVLLAHIHQILEAPDGHLFDGFRLVRWLLSDGDDRGLELLKKEFRKGNQKAGIHLGFHYKRCGQWEQAARLWRALWDIDGNSLAGIELAKYLEHRARDIPAATVVVESLLDGPTASASGSLLHVDSIRYRLSRLVRKSSVQR